MLFFVVIEICFPRLHVIRLAKPLWFVHGAYSDAALLMEACNAKVDPRRQLRKPERRALSGLTNEKMELRW
jgi:hypothetical protein